MSFGRFPSRVITPAVCLSGLDRVQRATGRTLGTDSVPRSGVLMETRPNLHADIPIDRPPRPSVYPFPVTATRVAHPSRCGFCEYAVVFSTVAPPASIKPARSATGRLPRVMDEMSVFGNRTPGGCICTARKHTVDARVSTLQTTTHVFIAHTRARVLGRQDLDRRPPSCGQQ